MGKSENAYWLRERKCEMNFAQRAPFWFLTANNQPRIIFADAQDFKAAMNATAVGVARTNVTEYMHVIMNNHGHWVFGGCSENDCMAFWSYWRNSMAAVEEDKGCKSDLRKWGCHLVEVTDLKQLRSVIAYTARNPYNSNIDCSPYGYKWTTADLIYNNNLIENAIATEINSVNVNERRRICRTRDYNLPEAYRFYDGMITKSSYVDIRGVEELFVSGKQYFRYLARNVEADIETSRFVGEVLKVNDSDMFSNVSSWCHKDYGINSIRELTPTQRVDVAKRMRYDYNSSNRQIANILRIPEDMVDRMFP